MTKKHFIKIAARLAEAREDATPETLEALTTLAHRLAEDFAGWHPNFDREKFITAAGSTDTVASLYPLTAAR